MNCFLGRFIVSIAVQHNRLPKIPPSVLAQLNRQLVRQFVEDFSRKPKSSPSYAHILQALSGMLAIRGKVAIIVTTETR